MKRWIEILTTGFKIFQETVREVFRGLVSKDRQTKFMALLCLISLVLAISVGGMIFWRARHLGEIYAKKRHAELELERLQAEGKSRKEEEHKIRSSQITLDVFRIELKLDPGQKMPPGIDNQAEIQISIFCDTPETRDYIEANEAQVRNEIVGSLTSVYRNQIISADGKRVIKRQIMERLNTFLQQGKVKDVYFTNLLVN